MSLHPGGMARTAQLIEKAVLYQGQKILEIGSGTGYTTATLLNLGCDVSIVECNQRLLQSAIDNCVKYSNKNPKYYLGRAENINSLGLESNTYDVVMLECVLGFINDKKTFLSNLKKYLKDGAKILFNDIHYIKNPDEHVITSVSNALEHKFEVLFAEDWKTLFNDFVLLHWEEFVLNASPLLNKKSLMDAILAYFPSMCDLDDELCEVLTSRLNYFYKIFNENKKFCKAHIGIFEYRILN